MNTRVCGVGGGGGGVEKGPSAMGREQIFGTHQRMTVQHHRPYILYTHVYTHTIPTWVYIYNIYLDSSRPSTDPFEGRILCRSFLKHHIHVYNIIVYVSARDGHVLRRFGNVGNIRPFVWFNVCGFTNNAKKVIMIHNFVGVWPERNKSILAISYIEIT